MKNINNNLSQSNKAILIAISRGYKVTKDGRLVNKNNNKLKPRIDTNGYLSIVITTYNNKKRKMINLRVHRLQAYQKFGNKLFEKGIEVRHLNGNPLDNSWDNISIGNHSDNMMDVSEKVRKEKSIKASNKIRKFTDKEMAKILEDRANGMTYNELMKKYDISSKGTMSFICHNKYVTKK